MKKIFDVLKLMRVKHYIKNILIFLPLLFSKNILVKDKFLYCFLGYIVFCLFCSCIYIINDIRDVEKDKLHFKKKNRPIASGSISIKKAIFILILLFLLGVFIIIVSNISLISILFLGIYIFMNLLYSFGLKNVPIVDLVILTFGFVIRVLYGASMVDVEVSNWLYLTVMCISFYLALGKRRNEILFKKNTREVLKYYTNSFLDKNMYMFLGMAIVFYSLWTIDISNSNYLIWTVPFVIIIAMRYSMIIENGSDGDPVEVIINDKILLFLGFIYCLLLFFILYFL